MHQLFITGTSRGLGAALAKEMLISQSRVFCVSRSGNSELVSYAQKHDFSLVDHRADLTQISTEELMGAYFDGIDPSQTDSLTLIHNAGLLEPINLVGQQPQPDQIAKTVAVNLTACAQLTEHFVARTQDWPVPKRVLFISSGAGRSPRAGWSVYCSTKAAIDMYARVLAEEQAQKPHPVRSVSLAPGVVDTDMQDLIRAQDEESFPSRQRFVDLKEKGQLWSPEFTAGRIREILHADDFGEIVLRDVRDSR